MRSLTGLWSVTVFPIMTRLILGLALVAGTVEAVDKERGRVLFQLCTPCHGENGTGQQIATLSLPAIAGLYAWYTEAQLTKFQSGHRGAHPNDPKGLMMRPMSRILTTKKDVKAIAAYVESLDKKKSIEKSRRIEGNVKNGKYYYDGLCVSCHGAEFQGNDAPSISAPSHRPLDDWYILEQLEKFSKGIRGVHPKDVTGARMRPIVKDLLPQLAQIKNSTTEEAMKDVVAYIYSQREKD
ncbi:MAG TPA: c-type cytochrome [Verrucomicrobiales bacterium]|nr:c-type cytochrome [Verrucomicrobiales bacterium]HIL69559.1 c-type cytochrome [Verrucomicrobiota bacterium]